MEWSDKIQKAFFILLRAGLWNRDIENPLGLELSEDEWKIVWQQATQQAVRGIIFDGICFLPEDKMPDEQLMIRWTAEIDGIERRNRYLNDVLSKIVRKFGEVKSVPIVLKGQGIACLYENPYARECGDIDLFFYKSDDERIALDWLKESGIVLKKEPDGTYAYEMNGVEIEHHHRLFDLYARNIQTYLVELIEQYGFVDMKLGEMDVQITVPHPILHLLLLNSHILKHMMGHGIGLRQLCDLARAYHMFYHQYSGKELKLCYQECGILRWSRLLHTVLVQELGLPICELPFKDSKLISVDPLLKRVLKEGNFGKYTAERSDVTQTVWKRKLKTGWAFMRHVFFSMTYAPHEVKGLVTRLLLGNLKS